MKLKCKKGDKGLMFDGNNKISSIQPSFETSSTPETITYQPTAPEVKGPNVFKKTRAKLSGFNSYMKEKPTSKATTGNYMSVYNTAKGLVSKQQGGKIEQEFVQWLAQVFGVESQEQLSQVVQQLGEEGMKQLQAAYQQGATPEQVRDAMTQAQSAKRGGVLNYYKKLMK